MNDTETLTRRATLGSFDPKARTFTAVAATTYPVRRNTFDGPVKEVLAMQPHNVRLSRFKSGRAPILDSHRGGSVSDQLGVVTDAYVERGRLIVQGRLSARDDERMQQIIADLSAGVIHNVSVGYSVHASEETRGDDGKSITITRMDWEPVELSLVSVPADPQAHIRSAKGAPKMPKRNTQVQELDDELDERNEMDADAGVDSNDDALPPVQRVMSDRHARQAYEMTARQNWPAEWARQHIESGKTMKEFRKAYFDRLAEEQQKTGGGSISARQHGFDDAESLDNPDFLSRSIGDALYARMTGKAPEGAATELAGRSLLELGAMVLQARGERVSWASRERLASQVLTRDIGGQHATTDFPHLLTDAGNRVLVDAYRAAECPLKRLARRRDAADFRAISMLKLSEAPRLLQVQEGAEIKYGTRGEAKEGFRLKTFARLFSISRNAIVNDDLNAFADANVAWGRAAAETEAEEIIALFTANSGNGVNLDDGAALYTTTRKNKAAAGAAIDVTNLGLARQAMRETKGLDGKTPVGVTPKHLVVGPAKETEAEQVLAALAAAQVSDVNPFSGKLTLHVEPRFTGNAWRIFADPAEFPTLSIGYLNGHSGPMLEVKEGWTVLGTEFRAVLDFGCGIEDWRGTYLNPGA